MSSDNDRPKPIVDPARIRDAVSGIRLTADQRAAHWDRIETAHAQRQAGNRIRRRQRLEYVVIGLLAVALVLFFWPFGGEQAVPAPEVDETREAVAETRTPSPEPDSTTAPAADATPSPALSPPTPTPTPVIISPCQPEEGLAIFNDFVDAFNAGDFDRIRRLLPDEPHGTRPAFPGAYGPAIEHENLYMFRHDPDEATNVPDEAIDLLSHRYLVGERWQVVEAVSGEFYRQLYAQDLDTIRVWLAREADDLPEHEMHGRVMVNCALGVLILWNFFTDDPRVLAAAAEPLTVEEFLAAAEPPPGHQMRVLRLHVSVDVRPDGGTLTEWEVLRREADRAGVGFQEEVLVRTLENRWFGNYRFDGRRWGLQQRGWEALTEATEPPPLSFDMEIARSEPQMTAELLRDHSDGIPAEGQHILRRDLDAIPSFLEPYPLDRYGAIEDVSFEVLIEDGRVIGSRYRMFDASGESGATIEYRFIEVAGDVHYSQAYFLTHGRREPGQQYQFPEPLPAGIAVTSEERASDLLSERYELDWHGTPLTLVVSPSRAGLDSDAIGDDCDPAWGVHQVEYEHGWIVWHDAPGAGHPVAAIWDNGWYRFELTIAEDDADAVWDEAALVELAELLSELPGSSPD
jgi:hypothetical protein